MKKKLFTGVTACALCAAMLAGCGGAGKKTVLGEAGKADNLSFDERTEVFYEILNGAQSFSSKFSALACKETATDTNAAVSPVSVYMALSLAAECSGGQTQQELLSALNVSYETLRSDFSRFFRSVAQEYRTNTGDLSGCVIPVNSIWLQEGLETNAERIQALADGYFCSSYAVDFTNDNKGANAAIREYVKKQTKGLIDQNFELEKSTLFTLINTLYLKEIWNDYGDDLPYADGDYTFTAGDGTKRDAKLLSGRYISGRAYETEEYRCFYTMTEHGYRLKFLVPQDGYAVNDIFTAENLSAISEHVRFPAYDEENKLHYNTRCLFPEFKASYNDDIKPLLTAMGVQELFGGNCDFSPLTDESVYAEKVVHVTELDVNKKGIEGAAVTFLPMAGAAAPGFQEYEEVYCDFVVDRAFGYVLENGYGTPLFSGIVNRP